MAYPTCPGCRVPQLVGDDDVGYTCFSCYSRVVFRTCAHCGYKQSVIATWTAFTCGECERRVVPPGRVNVADAVKARDLQGVGHIYPKL